MSAVTEKRASTSTGSPAQHAQPSRKGKKAWRKHVDIGEVEAGLEEMRAEERETGSSLHSKANDDLFQIDVKGDDKIRKSLPKFDSSQLSYNRLISQKSAVSAVFSRPSASSTKKRPVVSYEDKTRLLRIAKRKRLGPFNSFVDPTELGSGSAILEPSHAAKSSGTYDVWGGEPEPEVSEEKKDFLLPHVQKPAPKAPVVPDPRSTIELPAVTAPHQGASYNPPVGAHQELLRIAHEKAEEAERKLEKYAAVKKTMDLARKVQYGEAEPGVPMGMTVDELAEGDQEENERGDNVPIATKLSTRKTMKQRRKALQLRNDKRVLQERAARKRLLASFDSLKSIRRSMAKRMVLREQERLKQRLEMERKLKQAGLVGRKLGKHVVPEAAPDVQLGEELTESLRGLKVEGNLFRDRFLSLQQRALVEPRAPVLPKKHKLKVKEVEKHAWKRFE